jgi:DNA repair protein RadC
MASNSVSARKFTLYRHAHSRRKRCAFVNDGGSVEVNCAPFVTRGQRERPRERLLARGAAALSDAELVSLVLRTGVAGSGALDVARNLIARFGGIAALLAAPAHAIAAVHGVGPAKCAGVVAVAELARRSLVEEAAARDALASPRAVRDYLRLLLAVRPYEVFVGLFLDSQNRLLAAEELFRGTLGQTSVYPREVVKAALAHNAAAMIFAHNHPSGVAEPSRADELLTHALKQALALVDIRTLDHFVVAGAALVSFAERGLL